MFRVRTLFTQIRKLSKIANKQTERTNSVSLFNLDKQKITQICKMIPELSSYSEDFWYRSHETFTNYGITTNSYLEIVCKYPELIVRNPKLIVQSIELWRSCQFGEKYLFQLIQKYPNLLDFCNNDNDGMKLLKKTTLIRSYVTSVKNVWKLLMNSPNLIKDNDDIIEKKFDYLIKVMRIPIPEICKSEVFSRTLDEIKCRHVFLERLGLFKPRSLKAEPNEPSNNPRLYQIVDTSDKNFATKVCKVTLDEYETFTQLFKRELDNMHKNDEDDVDNDEIDDDFSDKNS